MSPVPSSGERVPDAHDNDAQGLAAPSPDATLVSLDERQLGVLRRVGREWGRVCGNPEMWRRALPVEPGIGGFPEPEEVRPTRFGRFVRVRSRSKRSPRQSPR